MYPRQQHILVEALTVPNGLLRKKSHRILVGFTESSLKLFHPILPMKVTSL